MIKRKTKERIPYLSYTIYILLTAVFIGYTLFQFNNGIEDRVYQKQIINMKTISMQGSSVVQKKMEGTQNTLHGLAEFIHEEDIGKEATIEKLKRFLEQHETGMQRIGLSGRDGKSMITNGERMDIWDREYFQNCLRGKEIDTEIRYSPIADGSVCIVAVPVTGEGDRIAGVLYGIMDLEEFQIYAGTVLENASQFIQIVDREGNYIERQESNLIGKKDNIFEGIASIEGQKKAAVIRNKVWDGEQVYTEVTNGKEHEILYFTPLELNDWCIVSVVDYEEVEAMAAFILNNENYVMTFKIIVAVLLMTMMITARTLSEYKHVKILSKRLSMDEKIVSIAAEKSGFTIMAYELGTRTLRFISNKILNVDFPRELPNADEEIMQYLPADENLRMQIDKIFNDIHQKTEMKAFSLSFLHEGQIAYLYLHLIPVRNADNEIVQYIGVLEDDMEGQLLREKADRDGLTGLYNRSGAQNRYKQMLESEEIQNGTVYAYMLMDLDNFKNLNDTLGHQTGDKALQDVADILTQHFRSYDVVSRLGGDEFFVFLKNIPKEAVERNIKSLLNKLILTYEEDGQSVSISASAGIVLAAKAPEDFSEVYKMADKALYDVKKSGKNGFRICEVPEAGES